MINTMLGYSSAADWWTKKMDPNSIRGTFNWDLLKKIVEVKKEEELDKEAPQFVSNEDALQQQHEEFIKQVELSGLPEWIVKLYY